MASRRKRSLGLAGAAARAAEAGRRSAQADLKVEEDNLRKENAARLLSLDMVQPRPAADTRPVDEAHVQAIAESVRVMGLIQPIYLDREFRLVAGAHRLSAFRLLAQEDPQKWSKIPVVVDPDLDAVTQPDIALRKEIVENEKRSNLTPAQVKAAAQRLLESDANFTRRPGRLKKGERAVTPFLADTFGVSKRYVRSLLNQPDEVSDTAAEADATGAQEHAERMSEEETQQLKLSKLYQKMSRQSRRWLKDPLLEQDPKLRACVERLLNQLNRRS